MKVANYRPFLSNQALLTSCQVGYPTHRSSAPPLEILCGLVIYFIYLSTQHKYKRL